MRRVNQKREKREKSKSYYYKYFGSYFIVLAVALLIMVLLYSQSLKLVKEQIQISSQNTLQQFFYRIDEIVKETYEICVTIGNNKKCMQYPRHAEQKPDKTTFEIWEIVNNVLNKYEGEKYHDVFVYFPMDDRIVSGVNGSLKLNQYYDVFYKESNEDDDGSRRDKFEELVKCTSGIPMLYSMGDDGANSYLCMAMKKYKSKEEKNNYTVVVVFDKSYISNVLQSAQNTNQGGGFLIHNTEKTLVFATDEKMMAYDLQGYKEEIRAFEQEIDGERYVMQVQESRKINVYYSYGISEKYYWEKLSDLNIVCSVGALVTIVIGILAIIEETRRVYRPVELLVENLKKMGASDYDEKSNTEFEFIEALFKKEAQEKMNMNISLRKGQELKREKFVYSLLNGTKENLLEDSNDIFHANGIDLCSDYFYVVVIDVEKNEGTWGDELEFLALSNVFCELINEENKGYMVLLPAGRCAILINARERITAKHLNALLGEGKNFLKQHCQICMTLGVSAMQEGIRGIHEAYEEACLALKYKYLLGKESIISYDQVSGRNFEYVPTSEAQLLFKVSKYLFEGGKKSAQELVEITMNNYGISAEASMETVECFKFETASVLNRVMVQGGYWSEQGKMKVQEILTSDTLQEFTQKLIELLDNLHEKQQEKLEERDMCVRAYEYIENHFAEQSLSLTFLGELFDVSSSYLSKLFKEKYRISIPDFITRIRIDNAKMQLRSTQYSIGKIAEENGFLSSSVFIKTFKKLEGITPGIYREFFEKNN